MNPEVNSATTPDPYFDNLVMTPAWELKLRNASQRIACFSVNYLISLVLLILTFPLSQEYIAPIFSTFMPISHTTLPKAILVFTVMYWLPSLWGVVMRWKRNAL